MKRIAWILVLGMLFVGAAQAYYVELVAPDTLSVGQILEVSSSENTNLKPGFSTVLIFYRMQFTKTEIARTTIVAQQGGAFSARFSTEGLEAGNYLLELVDPKPDGIEQFGGSSKTQKEIVLIDRQSEITITSPTTQTYTGLLSLKGSIRTAGNNGTQIQVNRDAEKVFGPTYIATVKNAFSTDVPITGGGEYLVTFSDSRSYIGMARFTVTEAAIVTTSPAMTPTLQEVVTATAPASRNQPAIFSVATKQGPVTIKTSSGIDWVLEYIDENNRLTTVNEKGTAGGETVTFTGKGGTVYARVYPFAFSDQGSVTLIAENADSVSVCTTCGALFTTITPPTTTQKTPLPSIRALAALAVFVVARRR